MFGLVLFFKKPVRQWTNGDGTVVRIYETDAPFKFRVTKNRIPYNPRKMFF